MFFPYCESTTFTTGTFLILYILIFTLVDKETQCQKILNVRIPSKYWSKQIHSTRYLV
jgi:hypothetical protein